MTTRTLQWSLLCFGGFVLCSLTACTRWIDVTPPVPQDAVSHSVPSEERVPLKIDTFRVSRNGAMQNPSPELERRILNAIKETQLFSSLVPFGEITPAAEGKAISARVLLDETIDSHPGSTALKGIVIGASMFLLAPIIKLNYDYTVQAHLELERWDGHVTRYTAQSAGTAHYSLFGVDPSLIDELKGQVIETCLDSLMNQLIHDTPLYMASRTPLPAPAIRSVTVGGRKPGVPPGTSPALPVTVKPAP